MFCTQCGKEIRELDRYCSQCGAATGVQGAPPRAAYATGPAGPPKRLVLSRDDRKLGGVCAGFAAYLDWDVTIVRLLFLCGVVYSFGLALFAYFIAWIVIPADPAVQAYTGGVPAVRSV
jgi:phage shock protein PspC (stress-responsive transcriptional regulator)